MDEPEKRYCCFGCRFAAAVSGAGGEEGAAGWMLARLGLAVFLSLNVMVFTMALWTQDFYGEAVDLGGASGVLRDLFRYLCMLFALPVLLLLGGPLWDNAWHNLRQGQLSTDLLLLLGVAASYLYSVIAVFREDGPVYFEVGCVVLVLVTLGRWLEAQGKLRTTAAIEALHRLLPQSVRRIQNGREHSLPLEEVAAGDCLRILPGERIPCDAIVAGGSASVDEQVLTGESQPLLKEPGDRVFAGSLDLDGELTVHVTAARHGSVLERMIDLVRQAQQNKGHYQRLADRVSAVFLPLVVLIALAALAWHGYRQGPREGVLTALAVLLIACPCALGLATPMAVWAALGQAALGQVLFRSGEALERLARVRAVRLDKTGTVTTGTPTVAQFMTGPEADARTALAIAVRLAGASTHAYAQAIERFAQEQSARIDTCEVVAMRLLPGRGINGWLEAAGSPAYLGSPRLMAEANLTWGPELAACLSRAEEAGRSCTCIGWRESVKGVFVFREEVRPEAAPTVAALRALGLDVALLTGDLEASAAAIGHELGLPVTAELLPEDKVAAIAQARRTLGPVCMVGDGINDAPALAASDVGVALGCGTDVSRASAAVCLLGNDLRRLPWAIELARQSVRVIRRNLFWAYAYNVIGIGIACTGRLSPVVAALAMVLSSLLVVSGSLRLSRPAVAPAVSPKEGTL